MAAPLQGLVESAPGEGLPAWDPGPRGRSVPWWWVGCHGGAGASTLAAAVGGVDAGPRGWPVHPDQGRSRVLLVARSHARGLEAAQLASRQWASGVVGNVDLLGLVVVADAPGRLPRKLQQWLKLVAGGVPHMWTVPWHEPWRLGEPVEAETSPKEVVRLGRQLAQALGGAGAAAR
ncbi:DUF6668 family protein [Yinghuangia sp. YIM S09857]|uniref:DUF6668 family protein n=1 Tax=Yinghuangia sp. YIM S09857 TaxID=3436929 RepID=UPI003F535756